MGMALARVFANASDGLLADGARPAPGVGQPVAGGRQQGLGGAQRLPHHRHVVLVPLVLVVAGQLQHADDLVHLMR